MKDVDFSVNSGPEGLTCGNTPVVIIDTEPPLDLRKLMDNVNKPVVPVRSCEGDKLVPCIAQVNGGLVEVGIPISALAKDAENAMSRVAQLANRDGVVHHHEIEDCADELDRFPDYPLTFLKGRLQRMPLPEKHGYNISRPNDLAQADFASFELKMYQNLKDTLYKAKYMKPNGYRFYPTMLAVQIALLCGFELKTYIEVSYAADK